METGGELAQLPGCNGNVKKNVDPTPSSEVTHISPPNNSTRLLEIDRPSPAQQNHTRNALPVHLQVRQK